MVVQRALPVLIQAGMGVGISDWKLANTVSKAGHLGVVSGTTIDTILVRRLQTGDNGGHIRRALKRFPLPEVSENILNKYFKPEGLSAEEPFKSLPLLTANMTTDQRDLLIVANFVEVYLAKEGHYGKIGINFLEKIQLPVLPSLFGAMLAGVDYVLMGAGIPREIPGVLDQLSQLRDVEYKLQVKNSAADDGFSLHFSPRDYLKSYPHGLKRPKFLAIISSSTLAASLAKKSSGEVNGFIVEAPTAGGHNAPPRGKLQLSSEGEPVYGPRDDADLAAIAELGLPFWLAGSQGGKGSLQNAFDKGATGIQVGTAFALCNESGLSQQIKENLIKKVLANEAQVFTDPLASPTGFPFKVAKMENTLSEEKNYSERTRICDLGYLREPFKKVDGTLGYRCASEPIINYVEKGGLVEDTKGRKCLCNGLMSNIGFGQKRKNGIVEQPLVTIGDDVVHIQQFISPGKISFSVQDVINTILN